MERNLVVQQPLKVRIGQWINRGWDCFVSDPGVNLLIGLVAAALLAVVPFLIGPISAGFALAGAKKCESGKVRIEDFFAGFSRHFLPSLLSSVLIFLFAAVGLVFLIIPGIVILTMYMFTFHYMVYRQEDFWQAMESSRKLVSRDYFGFVAFGIVLACVNLLGVMLMGVGVVASLPITYFALTAAYFDCAGVPAPGASPAAPVTIA